MEVARWVGYGGQGLAPAFDLGGMDNDFVWYKRLKAGLEGCQQFFIWGVVVVAAVGWAGVNGDHGGGGGDAFALVVRHPGEIGTGPLDGAGGGQDNFTFQPEDTTKTGGIGNSF